MSYARHQSAAFTGHRHIPIDERNDVKDTLRRIIQNAYNIKDIRNFHCGMALGFDMLCAETVYELRSELPGIHLTAVVPQRNQSECYSATNKNRYNYLLSNADEVIVLNETFHVGCYLERNDWMLDHSSLVIAYYNERQRGGTFYTCKRAKTIGLPVVNLCINRYN